MQARRPPAARSRNAVLVACLLTWGARVGAQQMPGLPMAQPPSPPIDATAPSAVGMTVANVPATRALLASGNPAVTAIPLEPVSRLVFSVDSRAVLTNNAGADNQTGKIRKDLVLEVQPTVNFERRSPHLRLAGEVSVSGIDYVDHSQASRVLPRLRTDMSAKLIDNLAFLDAWVRVDPTFDDPYAAHPEATTSYLLEPQTRYNLTPYIKKQFGDAGTLQLRGEYNNAVVSDIASVGAKTKMRVTSTNKIASFQHEPRPFGIEVEVKTHDETNNLQPETVLNTKEARLWLDFAIDPQLSFGVVIGREKTSLLIANPVEDVRGWRVHMRPNDRTDLNVTVENRYFGRGVEAAFTHRSPLLAVNLQLSRTVTSQPIPALTFATGDIVQDSITQQLQTRFPNDPAAQQDERNKLLPLLGGLGPQADGPAIIYSKVAQLRQSGSLQIGLRGARHFLYVQYGYLNQRALQLNDTLPADDSYDALQRLAGVGLNTNLTPTMAVNVMADWSRIQDLGASQAGKFTQQRVLRGEIIRTLTPLSTLTVGVRKLSVTQFPPDAANTAGETAVYVGLHHRF